MNTILIPTDFSKCAENAIKFAIEINKGLNAQLVLFNSVNVPNYIAQPVSHSVIEMKETTGANDELQKVRTKLLSEYPDLNIECLVDYGVAVDNIIAIADAKKADLIIMGTKGASGFKELFGGTNAAAVLDRASCPVLVIPEKAVFKTIKKIVFATNFSDSDFSTIRALIELAEIYLSEIMIVHISEFRQSDNYEEELQIWFNEELRKKGNINYKNISVHHLIGGNTDWELEQFIEKNNVDLLSLSMRKRTFFSKIFSSSLSKTLAYHARVPLLVFHVHVEK